MTIYVKYNYYNEMDNCSDFVYGYISGYLTDKDGNHLAVIVTRDNKIVTQNLNKLMVISEKEYTQHKYWRK
jgi:hypothetical protein